MIEELDDIDEPSIGVGPGGSCPKCRAPVDLGQEFCLECGTPIRFAVDKKKARARTSKDAAPKRPKAFPVVPVLIILLLVFGGIAFALMGDGDSRSSSETATETTEPALPQITNAAPDPTETDSSDDIDAENSGTLVLENCDPAIPISGSLPGGETIPTLPDDSGALNDDAFGDAFDSDLPSIDPVEPDLGDIDVSMAVDQNGNPCSDDASADQPSPTPPPASTTPTTTPSANSDDTTSSDWSGGDGWTVVVFGFPEQSRATTRAADVQAQGHEAGVLRSDEYGSLCPGYYVVFSGNFRTESAAKAHEAAVKRDFRQAYVREIKRTGSATGCSS